MWDAYSVAGTNSGHETLYIMADTDAPPATWAGSRQADMQGVCLGAQSQSGQVLNGEISRHEQRHQRTSGLWSSAQPSASASKRVGGIVHVLSVLPHHPDERSCARAPCTDCPLTVPTTARQSWLHCGHLRSKSFTRTCTTRQGQNVTAQTKKSLPPILHTALLPPREL